MKTLKNILVVGMLSMVLTGFANDISDEKTKAITIFRFVNVKKGHQILIKNDNGSVIHRETVERNGNYAQFFDLSNLDDGFYTIEVDKDFEIIIKPFRIASKKVIYLNDKQTTEYKPVVRTDKNKVIISQLALNAKKLNIKLYYEDELIHEDTLKGASILDRVYSLSDDRKGKYSLIMTSGNREYVEFFSI